MSLEKALGLALMQFCKATNGCTQSEPCAKGKKSFWHFIERLQIHFHVTGNVPGIEY
jgi:NADH:ubiquinone oxidoreductase subunit F (NADH-binding)